MSSPSPMSPMTSARCQARQDCGNRWHGSPRSRSGSRSPRRVRSASGCDGCGRSGRRSRSSAIRARRRNSRHSGARIIEPSSLTSSQITPAGRGSGTRAARSTGDASGSRHAAAHHRDCAQREDMAGPGDLPGSVAESTRVRIVRDRSPPRCPWNTVAGVHVLRRRFPFRSSFTAVIGGSSKRSSSSPHRYADHSAGVADHESDGSGRFGRRDPYQIPSFSRSRHPPTTGLPSRIAAMASGIGSNLIGSLPATTRHTCRSHPPPRSGACRERHRPRSSTATSPGSG